MRCHQQTIRGFDTKFQINPISSGPGIEPLGTLTSEAATRGGLQLY